jgi:hypothetical protein
MTKSATTRQNKGGITDISHGSVRLIAFPHSNAELIPESVSHALTLLYELLEEYAPSWYTQEHHEIAKTALNDLKHRWVATRLHFTAAIGLDSTPAATHYGLPMKKDSIELRHLRYFAAFCESGETSEAAKHLGVAPTTVKRCIRELERFLNVKLLVRGTRTLTDSGKLMHTHAK